jgi:hypothetical protein
MCFLGHAVCTRVAGPFFAPRARMTGILLWMLWILYRPLARREVRPRQPRYAAQALALEAAGDHPSTYALRLHVTWVPLPTVRSNVPTSRSSSGLLRLLWSEE